MHQLSRLFILLLILPLFGSSAESKLYQFLKSLPGAEITAVDSSAWEEYYVVMFPQPLDHQQPGEDWNLLAL